MAAQDIYVSPRKIINNLRLIEAKVPRQSFEIYKPSQTPSSEMTENAISKEAQIMFDFAGLTGYVVNVTYEQLPEGVGGQILLNASRNVEISISESYKCNWPASLAVLAHEICHKVLFVNGLNLPTTLLNEVYTDLTTIYIGFGQLILNGCVTQQNGTTHFLGYLTVDTYKITHLLVCAIYGEIASSQTGYATVDPFVIDALQKWESIENKGEAIGEIYIKRSRKYISFLKDIQRLEQLLKHCKTSLYHQLGQLEESFFQDIGSTWNESKNKLAAFAIIYEQCVWEKEMGTAELSLPLASVNKAVSNATYDIFIKYQEVNQFEFHNAVSCPFCGETILGKRGDRDVYVEACPHCGKHFVYDASPWNPTARQREINDERISRENLFAARVDSEAEKRVSAIRRNADAEIKDIRENERGRYKDEVLSSVPKIFRPLFKKYMR